MGTRRFFSLLVVVSVLLGWTLAAEAPAPRFVFTHAAERTGYLANAVIWRDPGPLTPEQIRVGPPAALPPPWPTRLPENRSSAVSNGGAWT